MTHLVRIAILITVASPSLGDATTARQTADSAPDQRKNPNATSPPRLPTPPYQNHPWDPPAFPKAPVLLDAAATLFRQGLPDPRGCEYREFEALKVASGPGGILGERGSMSIQKLEGWIVPTVTWKRRRVAIGWNGVIYRVETIGKEADLRAYVAKAVKKRSPSAWDEGLLEACLLLRLGETDLAARILLTDLDKRHDSFAYLEPASDWADALFQMGLSAHMHGHDTLAEAYLREWVQVSDRAVTEGRRRLSRETKDRDFWSYGFSDTKRQHVKRLVADQTRRRLEYGGALRTLNKALRLRNQPARIDALIELLDEVKAQALPLDDPGYPDLLQDPIVQALIREGLPAFPALLRAEEHDSRLTRSVAHWRWRRTSGDMLTAGDAARTVLHALLGEKGQSELTNYLKDKKPPEWADASRTFLREWWKRTQSMERLEPTSSPSEMPVN